MTIVTSIQLKNWGQSTHVEKDKMMKPLYSNLHTKYSSTKYVEYKREKSKQDAMSKNKHKFEKGNEKYVSSGQKERKSR